MRDEEAESRKQRVIEAAKKAKDYLPKHWAYAAEHDIDFFEAYMNLYNTGLSDGKALPAKTRELITIGILAFRARESGVYDHIKRALKLGATRQEILEAVETSMIAGGAPAWLIGMQAFMKVLEEEEKGE